MGFHLDTPNGSHHDLVDTDAFDSGRRIGDVAIRTAERPGPPRVVDCRAHLAAGMVPVTKIADRRGKLPSAQFGVGEKLARARGDPAKDCSAHQHIRIGLAQSERKGPYGHDWGLMGHRCGGRHRRDEAEILAQHLGDVVRHRVVVVELQARNVTVPGGEQIHAVRRVAVPVVPVVRVDGDEIAEVVEYACAYPVNQFHLLVGPVHPVAKLETFVDNFVLIVVSIVRFVDVVIQVVVDTVDIYIALGYEIAERSEALKLLGFVETFKSPQDRGSYPFIDHGIAVIVDSVQRQPKLVSVVIYSPIARKTHIESIVVIAGKECACWIQLQYIAVGTKPPALRTHARHQHPEAIAFRRADSRQHAGLVFVGAYPRIHGAGHGKLRVSQWVDNWVTGEGFVTASARRIQIYFAGFVGDEDRHAADDVADGLGGAPDLVVPCDLQE